MTEQMPERNPINRQERPLLTEEEISQLLERLHAKRGKDDHTQKEIDAMDEEEGLKTADDKFDRDLIEAISEYFRIDFERLRKIPLTDANLLHEEFYRTAPKELLPPMSAEDEMNLEAYINTPFEKHLARWKENLEKEKLIDLG